MTERQQARAALVARMTAPLSTVVDDAVREGQSDILASGHDFGAVDYLDRVLADGRAIVLALIEIESDRLLEQWEDASGAYAFDSARPVYARRDRTAPPRPVSGAFRRAARPGASRCSTCPARRSVSGAGICGGSQEADRMKPHGLV